MLLASATSLPLLLAAAGCRSSEVFAGPDPLAGRPRLSPDVITLQAVIAAEHDLISFPLLPLSIPGLIRWFEVRVLAAHRC